MNFSNKIERSMMRVWTSVNFQQTLQTDLQVTTDNNEMAS